METKELIELLNDDLETEFQSIVQYVRHVATISGAEFTSTVAELKVHLGQELQHATTLAEQVSRVFLDVAAEKTTVITADLPSPSLMAFGASQNDSTGARQRNDRLGLLAGRYYSDELDLSVNVAAREGVLVVTRPRGDELRFVPLAEDLFTSTDKMLLHVLHDSSGDVSGFALTVNRVRDLEFSRKDP
jgi:hypothetical protein